MNSATLILIGLFQGGLLALLAVEIARLGGPQWVKVATWSAALVSWVLSLLVVPHVNIFVTVLFVLSTVGAGTLYGKRVASGIKKQKELAPQVVAFCRANFDRLAGPKGLDQVALFDVLDADSGYSADDRRLVDHILWNLADVGHHVDTLVAYGACPMSGSGVAVSIYAISRADLDSYEARLKQKYKNW